MYERYIKRWLDVLCAIVIVILISPFLVFIVLLIRIFNGSPVIFKQDRPGYKNKVFQIYKFRTMIDKFDKNGNEIDDSRRITKIGKFLRASSLDELPQLYNILIGDMSFIGPRPLLPMYIEDKSESNIDRHDVRPGVTGLAQINGRNMISYEKRFEYDVEYIKKLNFWLDCEIMIKTVFKLAFRHHSIMNDDAMNK